MYIFEEPTSEKFKLVFSIQSLWEKFKFVSLRKNHRQGEDKIYADILNRIRSGTFTDDDIKKLQTRVFPVNDQAIPGNALVITCTNAEVNRINESKLALISEPEFTINSINKHSTKKEYSPKTDASGAISGTTLQLSLKIKKGAKVMLTHNVDTADCLTNGAFGEVVDFKFDKIGQIKEIFVKFYNEDCGRERRKGNIDVQKLYPNDNVVATEKIEFIYSISKNAKNGSATATAYQFPLRLAFASTAHKVQGLTIKKPNSLVVDLRSVREHAQAYVILSRVQSLDQIYILESLCPEKITACTKAITELTRMTSLALNENVGVQETIISCNVRSLNKNFEDLIQSSAFKKAKVLCVQETWLDSSDSCLSLLRNTDWSQRHVCIGRGKGISTFYKQNFEWKADIKCDQFQMTLIESKELDIINIYRSDDAVSDDFIKKIGELLNPKKPTIITGDFNLCYTSQRNHSIFKALDKHQFKQLVTKSTQIEGRIIDLVFTNARERELNVSQIAQYFTDHDLIEVR